MVDLKFQQSGKDFAVRHPALLKAKFISSNTSYSRKDLLLRIRLEYSSTAHRQRMVDLLGLYEVFGFSVGSYLQSEFFSASWSQNSNPQV
ncbi:hypothetical protein WAI453_010106 [Rhynchosporium graminicola]